MMFSCHEKQPTLPQWTVRQRTTAAGGSAEPVERDIMSFGTILLVVLVLMLLGALPTWPHSRNWGYYPSGGLGLVLAILVVMLLLGRI